LAQLVEPAMQIIDVSDHLGISPMFERVGRDRYDVVLRSRRKRDHEHEG
jgi:hypothetical protein